MNLKWSSTRYSTVQPTFGSSDGESIVYRDPFSEEMATSMGLQTIDAEFLSIATALDVYINYK